MHYTIGYKKCPLKRLVFPAHLHHTEPKTFLSPSSKSTIKSKTGSVGPGRYSSIFLTKDQRWGKMYILRPNIRALLSMNHTSHSFLTLTTVPSWFHLSVITFIPWSAFTVLFNGEILNNYLILRIEKYLPCTHTNQDNRTIKF